MIDVTIKRLQLKHAWTISRNSSQFKDNVFVKLEKDGVIGLGEAAPNVRYGETAELAIKEIQKAEDIFEDYDWSDHKNIKTALDKRIADQNCAKAALDIALLDWNSKVKSLPLHKFLGLELSQFPPTSFSIGIDSLEMIKQKIFEAKEFPILKIKLGIKGDELIMDNIRKITDKLIRVDANEGWKSKEEALEKIQWLEKLNVEFIEQPMPSTMIEEQVWLKEKSTLPIIADEAVKIAADIPEISDAYDGINVKLMKAGGIQEALKMIRMAKTANLRIMLGCMIESSLAISAAAQLAPLADWLDLDGNLLIDNDPFTGIKIEKGQLVYNDQPGIGVCEKF